MKKLIFTNTITLILLMVNTSLYSQSDSGTLYNVENISIDHSTGLMKTLNSKGIIEFKSNSMLIEDIYKVQFLSDSIVSVSSEARQDVILNINNIEQITVNTGTSASYVMGGIGLGSLFGFGVGALVYGVTKEDKKSSDYGYNSFGDFEGLNMLSYAGVGLITGAVIGGIMGAIIPSHKSYDLSKYKSDKKKQIEKILRKERISPM